MMPLRPFGKPAKQTGTVRESHGSINPVANARTMEFLVSTDARTIAEIGVDQVQLPRPFSRGWEAGESSTSSISRTPWTE
jgi:hypothetical protein